MLSSAFSCARGGEWGLVAPAVFKTVVSARKRRKVGSIPTRLRHRHGRSVGRPRLGRQLRIVSAGARPALERGHLARRGFCAWTAGETPALPGRYRRLAACHGAACPFAGG